MELNMSAVCLSLYTRLKFKGSCLDSVPLPVPNPRRRRGFCVIVAPFRDEWTYFHFLTSVDDIL